MRVHRSLKCILYASSVAFSHSALAQQASTPALTKNGVKFIWANQAGASVSGGGTATATLAQPAHPGISNEAALVTPLPSADGCYDALTSSNGANSSYTSGMILNNSATGVNTVFENAYANTSGSAFLVDMDTGFSVSGSSTNLAALFNQMSYPLGAEYFQRVCVSGQNVLFETSPTGASSSFQTVLSTTLSAIGNPNYIGVYTDADGDNNESYSSNLQFLKWRAYTSSSPQVSDPGGDLQANFLLFPAVGAGIPTSNSTPVISGDTPKFGLTLAASSSNVADMTFPGSGEATITVSTSGAFRKYVYVNSTLGQPSLLIGSPQDFSQGENGPFWGAERTYPANGNNDLIPVTSDGLKIKAHCAGVSYSNCAMNQVRSGAFRLPTDFRPGMTMELTYRPPTGYHSWTPWWLYSGAQTTSYPNSYGSSPGSIGTSYGPDFEIDINDNYPRHDSGGCPIGGQVDFSTPNIYGVHWNVPPYMEYAANSNGWSNQGGQNANNSTSNQYECETGFVPGSIRTVLFNWRGDGSNLLDVFVNGRRVNSAYMEYPQTQTYRYPDGVTRNLGMTMILGGQTVANFSDDISNMVANPPVIDNDGSSATSPNGDAGWTETVYSVKAWNGNIANPNCCDAGVNAATVKATQGN